MSVKLEKMSLPELMKLKASVDAAIPQAKARETAAAKAEIMELAAKRGIRLEDVIAVAPKKTAKATTGRKIAPKWIDSQTGVKWTGRGRQPKNFDKARAQALS